MNEQTMNDVAKEVSCILKYIEPELLKKIPTNIIKYLQKLAEKSNIEFKLEVGKELNNQKILEETKDLLALIFYLYIADKYEKKEIMACWNHNENQYQEILKEKYQINFKKIEHISQKTEEEKSLIMVEENGKLFSKIKRFIYKIFKNRI